MARHTEFFSKPHPPPPKQAGKRAGPELRSPGILRRAFMLGSDLNFDRVAPAGLREPPDRDHQPASARARRPLLGRGFPVEPPGQGGPAAEVAAAQCPQPPEQEGQAAGPGRGEAGDDKGEGSFHRFCSDGFH